MEFQPKPPHQNGYHEAPPLLGGASVVAPQRTAQPTVFPAHVPLAGLPAFTYGLHRFHAFGVPLFRLPVLLLTVLALLWLAGALPGRWIGAAACVVLAALLLMAGAMLRRRRYVTFAAATAPALDAAPLPPQEKLPIYATGLLSVEGKARPFTFLPGFYRTFATGEHAVLCRAAGRRWLLVGEWPPEEHGMWYAFVQPDAIISLAWGELQFGVTRLPAIAVAYRHASPTGGRGRVQVTDDLLYLACASQSDALRIFADLHRQLPPGVRPASSATRARRHDPS